MGTPTQINKQAEQVLKEILTNPEIKRTVNSMQARKYGGNALIILCQMAKEHALMQMRASLLDF